MGIFNNDPDASGLGIVNIDLDGCSIMLWPSLSPYPVSFKKYWYDATKVNGADSYKLVVGCRSRNVNNGNADPDSSDKDSDPYPWRFSIAIAVYTWNNALIANKLIDKASKISKTSVACYKNIPYPYDNRYGIDVNQILYGGVLPKTSGGPSKATPENSPYYFKCNVTIRDNYVFLNGRVGISRSGSGDGKTIGSGPQIISNRVEIAADTTCYSVDGKKPATGADTNENRGFNQQGYESNVTSNTGHINR